MQINNLLTMWSDEAEFGTKPNMLTTNMKVLMLISLDSEITQVAMSVVLRVSETAIEKAVANLENDGIVTIERSGRRNRYIINGDSLANHREIVAIKEFVEHVQTWVKHT